jgi:hypothetical protein
MSEINKPTALTYHVITNVDESIVHYGLTDTDQVTTSALTELETFTNEQDYLDRLDALGIDPNLEEE